MPATKTVVIHRRDAQPGDVFIDRETIWGNPYVIGRDGTRKECIAKYRKMLTTNRELMAQIETLRGKRLVCWCKPDACHGDVLVDLLETNSLDKFFS